MFANAVSALRTKIQKRRPNDGPAFPTNGFARLGKVTASRVADLMAKTDGLRPAGGNYGRSDKWSVSRAFGPRAIMPRYGGGTDTEPPARAAYEFLTDAEVVEDGFVLHPAICRLWRVPGQADRRRGASGGSGAPTRRRIETLLTGEVPSKLWTRCRHQWLHRAGVVRLRFVRSQDAGDVQLFRASAWPVTTPSLPRWVQDHPLPCRTGPELDASPALRGDPHERPLHPRHGPPPVQQQRIRPKARTRRAASPSPRLRWAKEHADLVRRVWDDMPKVMWGGGLMFRARWNGDTLTPTGHYGLSAARETMEPGDVVIVGVDHPRSAILTGTNLPDQRSVATPAGNGSGHTAGGKPGNLHGNTPWWRRDTPTPHHRLRLSRGG